MSRLADALRAHGHRAEVFEHFRDDEWRALTSAGALGRMRARLAAYALFPARTLLHAFKPSTSVLVPTTNPFFLPLVLTATKALHRKPVVPLVYDLYPDAFEASRPLPKPIANALAAANRFWFERADALVFIGANMASHACARYAQPKRRDVIVTGASVDEFATGNIGDIATSESELERWCDEKIVVTYVGNMGRMHDWRTLADAGRALFADDQRAPKLACVVAASGPGAESLRKAWSDLPSERVRFEAPLADRAWARLLAKSAISIVTLADSAAHISIPSKTFSAMAAGNAIVVVAPSSSDIAAIVKQCGAGVVVAPGDVDALTSTLAHLAHDEKARTSLRASARTAAREQFDMPVLAQRWADLLHDVAANPRRSSAVEDGVRRAVDVAVSAGVLAATTPVLGAAAVAVRATMGPGVLFRQKRPGLDGKPFELLKLRTMRHPKPGEDGVAADARRLTALGKFLRATSIDELPTLWNVLKGDMSLVGPRPLLMQYLSRYSREQARRHEVKPGITGWAQVNGRNALSWDEKFRHDVWYVDHRSLALDAEILVKTALHMLKRDGIDHPGHATMPEFMGTTT